MLATMSEPSRSSTSLTEGSCMAAFTASHNFVITGAGVPAGARSPIQDDAS